MLKRHEVEILLKAGHAKTEVARLSGVSLSSVKRIAEESPVVETKSFEPPACGKSLTIALRDVWPKNSATSIAFRSTTRPTRNVSPPCPIHCTPGSAQPPDSNKYDNNGNHENRQFCPVLWDNVPVAVYHNYSLGVFSVSLSAT